MNRVSRSVVVGLLALPLVAAVSPTTAAKQNIVAHSIAGYATPALVMEVGDSLDFVNADPLNVPHNVVEDLVDTPRFSSATVAGGVTTPVNGVETLAAGTYNFFCSLHPWMKGALEIVADGTLPADPPPITPTGGGVEGVVALPGGVVPTPTSIDVTDTHLYATSYAQGAVVRMPILADGVLGAPETVAAGFSNPLGVVVAEDGTVFVADSHAGGPDYSDRTIGRVQALPAAGGGPDVVVDGLPNGRHNTNNMAIHGGRLYITNGNSTDDGINGGDPELPLSGTLVSVALGARGIVVPPDGGATPVSGLEVEALGMRNLYDVAFRPGTPEAWITVNGPDTFDPYGEDTLVKVPDVNGVVETVTGHGRGRGRNRTVTVTPAPPPDFGFPECLYNAEGDILDNPTTLATLGPCGAHTPPEELLGLHVSADGLAFGPADEFWNGDLFIAEFGNFFGSEVVGHRVVRVPINDAGASSPPQDFVLGAAPLDLAFGAAGLYVADFAGAITLYRRPPV